MEPSELLERLVRVLEELGLRYLVTGSTATIFYGEPRFTADIDVVVDLPPERVDELVAAFGGDETQQVIQILKGKMREADPSDP